MKKFFNHPHFFLVAKSIYMQLFVLVVSFPVLAYWGLPISPLCLFSTPLFTPLLALFLFSSSLFFVCLIFGIPCGALSFILEKIASVWILFLTWKHSIPCFGFSTTYWPFLLFCPFFGLYVITSKKNVYKKIGLLAGYLLICTFFIKITDFYRHTVFSLACHNKKVSVYTYNGTIVVADPGAIGAKPSAKSWSCFELIPSLIKSTGTIEIHHFILGSINQRSFEAMTAILQTVPVHNIYMPIFKGSFSKKCWHAYFKCINSAKEKNCTITKVGPTEKIALCLDQITITPENKACIYHDACFYPLVVTTK